MNEIEKILKDNMEDYESVKRQALKFIHENKKELSKNYAYAEIDVYKRQGPWMKVRIPISVM